MRIKNPHRENAMEVLFMRIIILKQEYNYMKKWIYSGTREEQPSERELMHGKLARKAASEGIVLLKNEGILH